MTEIIINIVMAVVAVGSLCVTGYVNIKKKIQLEAENAINDAEDTDLVGAEKMEQAIDSVLAALPRVALTFVTRDAIRKVIQTVFDGMETYARKQQKEK